MVAGPALSHHYERHHARAGGVCDWPECVTTRSLRELDTGGQQRYRVLICCARRQASKPHLRAERERRAERRAKARDEWERYGAPVPRQVASEGANPLEYRAAEPPLHHDNATRSVELLGGQPAMDRFKGRADLSLGRVATGTFREIGHTQRARHRIVNTIPN